VISRLSPRRQRAISLVSNRDAARVLKPQLERRDARKVKLEEHKAAIALMDDMRELEEELLERDRLKFAPRTEVVSHIRR
jgi:hypothetical protein